jgi:hypothetical protein
VDILFFLFLFQKLKNKYLNILADVYNKLLFKHQSFTFNSCGADADGEGLAVAQEPIDARQLELAL